MYEKNVYEDGSVSISFFTSKSKVAQLNPHSLPRLELLGALLGLHLCQVVSKVLGDHVIKSLFSGMTARMFFTGQRIQAEHSNRL